MIRVPGGMLQADRDVDDPARTALAAGHPVTWAAITRGTSLDGIPYAWTAPTRTEETPR